LTYNRVLYFIGTLVAHRDVIRQNIIPLYKATLNLILSGNNIRW